MKFVLPKVKNVYAIFFNILYIIVIRLFLVCHNYCFLIISVIHSFNNFFFRKDYFKYFFITFVLTC